MMKRIEFTLDLDDPHEEAIYKALRTALQRRRAGAIIRQALDAYLLGNQSRIAPVRTTGMASGSSSAQQLDNERTQRIVEQSASMFGF